MCTNNRRERGQEMEGLFNSKWRFKEFREVQLVGSTVKIREYREVRGTSIERDLENSN